MPYELPALPYRYDALAPTIDELTMRVHHDKHHGGYVESLNEAVAGTGWADSPIEDLLGDLDRLPRERRAAVRFNAGGHANHTLFWEAMTPDGGTGPDGALADAIEAAFGSVAGLKRRLGDTALACVGSGWAWVVHDGTGLAITSTLNQDSPLMQGQTPLLGVDLWEHAYYLKYQNRRADYMEAWWNVIDWARFAARYEAASVPRSR